MAELRLFDDETRNGLTGQGDERIAFGSMARRAKRYGSTSNNRGRRPEDENTILYRVEPADTLIGLAIKFGVSTEQIRRINQLWTNDSLFLRENLLIPCTKNGNGYQNVEPSSSMSSFSSEPRLDVETSHDGSSGLSSPCVANLNGANGSTRRKWTTHPLSDSFESEDCSVLSPDSIRLDLDPEQMSTSTPNSTVKSSSSTWSTSEINNTNSYNHHPISPTKGSYDSSSISNGLFSPGSQSSPTSPVRQKPFIRDQSEKSAKDFLSRIDSVIESSRSKVKAKAEHITKDWVTFESDGESTDHSRTSVTPRQGRHIQYSLNQLEKAQDELFQL